MRLFHLIFVLLITAATSLLTGCLNVPFSTMASLSTLNGNDFREIQPQDIKVKVSLNEGTSINLKKTRLQLHIRNSQHDVSTDLALVGVQTTHQPAIDDLLSSRPAMDIHLLQLTPDSIVQFSSLQQAWNERDKNELTVTVKASIDDKALSSAETIYLSAAVKWKASDDFLLLIENMPLN